jgi:ATP-dependent Clp protease protease subunit
MIKNQLKISLLDKTSGLRFEPPVSALEKWDTNIHAAQADDDATINIYSTIGEDYFTGDGMTPKIVSAILRKNKGRAITVNINSPGGSFFDGVAIYNLLRDHDADINVRVIGLAASAASIVAMAGDSIEVAESGFVMIHNAWTIAMGNKNDMQEVSEMLATFDVSMAGVYSKQTGISEKEIAKMMDAETWISGPDAVDRGFATALLKADSVALEGDGKASYNSALRIADVQLAKAGMPRSERRALLKDLTGTPGAASEPTPRAGTEDQTKLTSALSALLQTVTN